MLSFLRAKKTKGFTLKSAFLSKSDIRLKGFTLIELLVVIGVLTVLLAIVLVAVNPSRQFSQANDTQRRSDVNAILNAVHQYAADNKGVLPTGIPTGATAALICKPTATCNGTDPAVDLCTDVVAKYLADIPRDPKNGTIAPGANTLSCDATTTAYDTTYTIIKNADNRVTVTATPEISGSTISVTR